MKKPADPRDLAVDLLPRSICTVRVGCAVTDSQGRIIGWGWNGVDTGFGLCAERHAFRRVNKSRLEAGTVYVAAEWRGKPKGKLAPAKPCEKCQRVIEKYHMDVYWRDKKGVWQHENNLPGEA